METRSHGQRWRRGTHERSYGALTCVACDRALEHARATHRAAVAQLCGACPANHPAGVYVHDNGDGTFWGACACCVDELLRQPPPLASAAVWRGYVESQLTAMAEFWLDGALGREPRACALCLAAFRPDTSATLVPCNHIFCTDDACVAYLNEASDCPVCRQRRTGLILRT